MNKKTLLQVGIVTAVAAALLGFVLFGLQGVKGGSKEAVVSYSWSADPGSVQPGTNDGPGKVGRFPAPPDGQPSRNIPVFNPYDHGRDPRTANLPPWQLPRDILIINAAPDVTPTPSPPGKDIVTTYSYDIPRERWIKQTQLVEPQNPLRRNNTIIVRLENDNPVKEIVIDEAIISTGSQPLLVIDGKFDATMTGKIHIGVLKFKQVDAAELEIVADVVRVQIQNTVARDDELRLELTPVNVVRIGRGGATSLFLGRDWDAERQDEQDDEKKDKKEKRVTGLRVDRIVIKGPQAGVGFVESITIKRTGVFGKIDIRNVAIQDLILQDVSLDDNINRPTPTPTATPSSGPLVR
ncbi:MAG: hypothetical protein HYY29_04580 [Chloroflexi bacterium]|nr:hypothetical protein [Chloroflexota bacterium]